MSDPLAAMRANMRAFYRLTGERSPSGAVVDRHGVLAAVVPACPYSSIVNGVVYERAEPLIALRDELDAAYRGAGVHAWTVWVPEADRLVARRLQAAGHKLDASPRAMTLELAQPRLDTAGEVELSPTSDVAVIARLNEAAYRLPAGAFAGALSGLAADTVHLYLARLDGEPAACLAAIDDTADCGIYLAATIPSARRRGLASALMRQALSDARARGCTTSSLQASAAGRSVYARLGYRDLGAIEMWEYRDVIDEASP